MSTAVQIYDPGDHAVSRIRFDDEQLALLKLTIAKGTTDEQFALFVEVAQRTGLNPFAKQIYAVVRKTRDGPQMTIQTGIDGFRLIAQRTGEYAGQRGPEWCGPDMQWREVWLDKTPPAAARVGVLRSGFMEPVWGVATYQSYVQKNSEGRPSNLWATMPDVMLAKCAEGLALRKGFPQELSGLYVAEEMGQADDGPHEPRYAPVTMPQRRSELPAATAGLDPDTGELPMESAAMPGWTNEELQGLCKELGIVVGDFSAVLGQPVTKPTYRTLIDGWLAANPTQSLSDLAEAVELHKHIPAPEGEVEQEPMPL